jgi:steroid 5-alpha reductase family enzyme
MSPSRLCNAYHSGFLLDELLSQFFSSSSEYNPYQSTFITCNIIAILCFIISSCTGNFSQVDKLWSIVPAMYAWMCVIDTRTTLMAFLATLWSVRLTYNFYRRGGYNGWPYNIFGGEEDYRWEILRRGTLGGWWTLLTNKYILGVFNLVFISLFQNWLLLYIASPSLVAWSMAMKRAHCYDDEGLQVSFSSLNALDGLASFVFLCALCIESMADNQQFQFQNKKHALNSLSGTFASATRSIMAKSAENKDLVDGFCQSGLFAIVRKPNYAAEQLIWISYYFFSVAASAPATWPKSQGTMAWVNWSMGGFILLCLLFQGSGWLTEQISISKYPVYRDYQRRVPLYIPKVATLWQLLFRNVLEKGVKGE